MPSLSLLISAAVVAGLICGPVRAATSGPREVDLPRQQLETELNQLARQTGIELLVDPRLTARMRGPAVKGLLTPERALALVLTGSGLTFRQTAVGAFVVVAAGPVIPRTPSLAEKPPEVGAVAEILVIARHSLNADIPRSRTDIQPYQVATSADIIDAVAESPEDFLRSHLLDDAAFPAATQEPSLASASPASQVNLRGLGLGETLLLLDGRRLPSTSLQPDLNAIPIPGIERIETLTSTAGGIFGSDALGGVLNLVQQRSYQGGQFSVTSGASTRGDAPTEQVYVAYGATNVATGTQVAFSANHTDDAGLDFGSRQFVQAASALAAQRTPGLVPTAGQVNVFSYFGTPLVLVPGLGGQSLGSKTSHVPLNVALQGSANEADILLANAGSYDLSLSPDGQGAKQSLLTTTSSNALLFSIRQPIGARLVAFADVVYLEDGGVATVPAAKSSDFLGPGAAGNPFQQLVEITYPAPGIGATDRSRSDTERVTLGLIAQLPRHWTAEMEINLGEANEHDTTVNDYIKTISVSPFSGSAVYQAALSSFNPNYVATALSDRLDEYSLRIAGPVFELSGGPVTVTLLAENHFERPPQDRAQNIDSILGSEAETYSDAQPLLNERVSSIYAETRVPLTDRDPRWSFLRGLELQLAIREDWSSLQAGQSETFTSNSQIEGEGVNQTGGDAIIINHAETTAFTAGFKVSPIDGVMLRASFADGYKPITPSPGFSFSTYSASASQFLGLTDPRRSDQLVGSTAPITLLDRGYPHPTPEAARTMSIGVVLTPAWARGLDLSIDYTRTSTSGGITTAGPQLEQFLLDNERRFPSRVVRAPLTPSDAAAGYTVGPVTSLDYSELQIASSTVDSVHLEINYTLATGLGAFRIRGQTTWTPNLQIFSDPTEPAYQLAGYSDGPVKWRANLGLDWSNHGWKAAINAQFYGSYLEAVGNPQYAIFNASDLRLQGGPVIPAQVYVDALVGYRSRLPRLGTMIDYRLGIRNILDSTPPLVVGPLPIFETVGYSPYGDPRGRRFEVSATAHF